MTTSPLFPRFDGLMHLAKRDGVDIRPTLLRVLTDLYVQSPSHTAEEQRQYEELALRLIDEVDDATRATIRARLAIYPETPFPIRSKLGLATPAVPLAPDTSAVTDAGASLSDAIPMLSPEHMVSRVMMQPGDASAIDTMFANANSGERVLILRNLEDSPLVPAAKGDIRRNERAVAELEKAALASDQAAFAKELAGALLLRPSLATRIVEDSGGELLACAAKALGMPEEVFQRVLLFLKPEIGHATMSVYRLARLYDTLSERSALIMLAVWRGAMVAHVRTKYRPALYDGERRRARPTALATPQPSSEKPEQLRTARPDLRR